jgi:nucleoside-diphosphate-sugar epimerase
MTTRALVTGGAGFIGSRVVRRLLSSGYDVFIYDSFMVYMVPDPTKEQPNLTFRLHDIYSDVHLIRGNTLDKDFLRRSLLEVKPDVIIHMAAMPLASVAIEHPEEAFQSILDSTHNILEIMRDFDHPCRLVYISSSMVYGDFLTAEIDENHPKNPKDVYGAFKLAGEIIVSAYAKNYGLDTVICRPSAVYGPFDTNNRVVQKFVANAMCGEPLTIDGDGSMRLDFTYVDDCAQGICLCATHPCASNKIFNITRGESRSLRELAEIIQQHCSNVEILYREAPAYMPKRGTLDIAVARGRLGFEPKITLEEGVRRYIKHLGHHSY